MAKQSLCWHDKPTLIADHARKMYVCETCRRPTESAKNAKKLYKVTEKAKSAFNRVMKGLK